MKPELYLLVLQAYQNISALVCRRRRKGETETSLYSRSTGIRKKTYAKFSLGCSFFWTDYASTFFEVSRAVALSSSFSCFHGRIPLSYMFPLVSHEILSNFIQVIFSLDSELETTFSTNSYSKID